MNNQLLPDEIFEDAAPLDENAILSVDALKLAAKWLELYDGKNMFVTLHTGRVLVGRVEVKGNRITVGNSELISIALVDTAREV